MATQPLLTRIEVVVQLNVASCRIEVAAQLHLAGCSDCIATHILRQLHDYHWTSDVVTMRTLPR